MPFVISAESVSVENISQVGGKAAHLGEMMGAGFPVPEAFFVTVEAFREFVKRNGLEQKIQGILDATRFDDVDSVTKSSEEIRRLVLSASVPTEVKTAILRAYKTLSFGKENVLSILSGAAKHGAEAEFVALRSSGVSEDIDKASSAGAYESFLNVRGEENVMLHVQKCWASFFTPRGIYYRNKNGQPQLAGLGVIVQRMVRSEKSGVTFTVDPTDPAGEGAEKIVIEAVWGLGETIVQGMVEPDHYVVDKRSGRILGKRTGKKTVMRVRDQRTGQTVELQVKGDQVNAQVLTDTEIVTIAAYGKKIEQYYKGLPQDIEWAVDRGKIYMLQTRAVTVLEKKEGAKVSGGEVLIKGYGVSPGTASGPVRVVHELSELGTVQKGDVLVTEMTSPDFVPAMEKSAAIVTDKGGSTCHAAIVSRELGIPCIVGTENATRVLKDGTMVTVDATNGTVYAGATATEAAAERPPEGRATKMLVKCNIAFPQTAEKAVHADGVGLLRLEHMLTEAGTHPMEYVREGRPEELTRIITDGVGRIAAAFTGKPVWVRTLDARTDEFRNLKGGQNEPKEDNPMLGWHGIRRDIDEPELFRAQIDAFKKLHENGHTNVSIMLPFIINAEELRKAKELARGYGLPETCRFGIMVETPAAALNVEEFCREGIEFISFGSNDLTQLTLGLDRNNERLIRLFDEMHPSMRFQFRHVIGTCRRHGVKTSICGELPSNREDAVRFLHEAGIDSVSVNLDAIEKVREWVRRLEG